MLLHSPICAAIAAAAATATHSFLFLLSTRLIVLRVFFLRSRLFRICWMKFMHFACKLLIYGDRLAGGRREVFMRCLIIHNQREEKRTEKKMYRNQQKRGAKPKMRRKKNWEGNGWEASDSMDSKQAWAWLCGRANSPKYNQVNSPPKKCMPNSFSVVFAPCAVCVCAASFIMSEMLSVRK